MICNILGSFCSCLNRDGADIRPQIRPRKIPALCPENGTVKFKYTQVNCQFWEIPRTVRSFQSLVSQGMSQNFTRFGLYYVKSLPDGSRTIMSLNCLEGLLTFVYYQKW